MIKKLLYLIALILIIVWPVAGYLQSMPIGPYEISMELGDKIYEFEENDPFDVGDYTLYHTNVYDGSELAVTVGAVDYETPQEEDLQGSLETSIRGYGDNPIIAAFTVDNREGYVSYVEDLGHPGIMAWGVIVPNKYIDGKVDRYFYAIVSTANSDFNEIAAKSIIID